MVVDVYMVMFMSVCTGVEDCVGGEWVDGKWVEC